jgi:cobalt/nickel transport system permease protein
MLERFLGHLYTLDELGRRDTPLGRIDARAKVLVVFGLLGTVASFRPHDVGRLLPLVLFLVMGFVLGDVPVRLVATRVLIASPFALLVGIWSPFFDSSPLWRLGPLVLSAGWVSFLSVLLRFVLALTAVLLLVATTGFDAMCGALGRLGVPRVLITQLVLLYRYSFVLVGEVARTLRAHALRSPERPRPTLTTARSLLGELLLRTLGRAERVHAAMLCRGFDGTLAEPRRASWRPQDIVFLIGWCAYFGVVRCLDLPRWLGGLVAAGAA